MAPKNGSHKKDLEYNKFNKKGAVRSALENTSGKFFHLTTEEEPAPPTLDMEAAQELWEVSVELGREK